MNKPIRAIIFGSLLLAMLPSAYANNSYSKKTIPVGLQTVQKYIPDNIFWVSFNEDNTERRYRALRYDNLKYDIDEGESHAYTVTLRLQAIDGGNHPVLVCDTIINYDYKDQQISELSKNVFGHYCEPY